MTYKNCTPHNGRWTFQLNILGFPLRTREHYETPEACAVACDLVKHYLSSEFKLFLPESMDGEQFSDLAYSRRGVNLSDCHSVLKSIPPDVLEFIEKHGEALLAHRDSAPPESTASKFRRSDAIKLPAVRAWVEQLESAEADEIAFATIDSRSFFLRLSVVEKTLFTAIKSLSLALRMHSPEAGNARLAYRASRLHLLIEHLEHDLEYVKNLAENLKHEQGVVETAVANLEANRPALG